MAASHLVKFVHIVGCYQPCPRGHRSSTFCTLYGTCMYIYYTKRQWKLVQLPHSEAELRPGLVLVLCCVCAVLTPSSTSSLVSVCRCAGKLAAYLCRDPRDQQAELRALATTTAEIIWLHWLLADFGVTCVDHTILRCDNTSVIWIANNPIKHELTKHTGVDASFIRSHRQQSTIDLQYTASN